jgi:hypothetical protein
MNIDLGKPRRLEGPVAKVIGTVVSALTGGMMGSKAPKPPEVKKPPTAPTPDDAARRRQRERTMARKSTGRASTLMEEENLG